MPEITMHAEGATLARLNLGEPDAGGFYDGDDSDLAVTGGNLYIYVDGVEIGSLFFHHENGRLNVALGRYEAEKQEWVERNPLAHPTPETVILHLESR